MLMDKVMTCSVVPSIGLSLAVLIAVAIVLESDTLNLILDYYLTDSVENL